MMNIGIPGLILILILALIIFGPSKLPQLGKAAGETLTAFKNSTSGIVDDVKDPINEAKDITLDAVHTVGKENAKEDEQ